ncbi:hypothetical protein CNYM01_12519 [Colletotrichum nymphaeae SA-01]|uniref:Uncharacterized protein n=1 Tax=Colletotrichum nymphaeae SA-01 TaxID=1460502 RepID=A0A135SUX7_9PEZI|nr:hypothetical protein CNYM01_12519 [Colletotrichum nymphaeae SA-01]
MGDYALPFLPLFIRTSSGFTNWQPNIGIPRARLDSKGECETCEFALRAHKAHIVRQIFHYASVSVPYTTVILIHTAHRQGGTPRTRRQCVWALTFTFRNDSCPCNCVLSLTLNLGVVYVTAAHLADHLGYGYLYLTLLKWVPDLAAITFISTRPAKRERALLNLWP